MKPARDLTAQFVEKLDAESTISLPEIIHKFRVRWRLFAACVVLVPLIAVGLMSQIPVTYKASAELLITHQGGNASFYKDMTADRGGISGQSASEILRSVPTCMKMVDAVGVTDEDIARSGFKVIMGKFFRLIAPLLGKEKNEGAPDPQVVSERIAAELKDSIEASTLMADRTILIVRDEIVEVKLKSTNRLKVAAMVNELCQIFIEEYNKSAAEDAMRAFETLGQQAAKVQAEMTALRSAPARPSSPQGIPPGAEQPAPENAGSLSRAKPLTEGMGRKISDLELRVIELERVFTESSPELLRAKAELEQARASLSRQEALDGSAALLDDIRAKQRQAMLTAVLHQSNQSGLTIIERGLTPKASKSVLIMHYGIPVGAGLVLGLILGTALVLLFSALDDRLYARRDIEPVAGLSWLGDFSLLKGDHPPALKLLPPAENLPPLLRLRGKIEDSIKEGLQVILITTANGENDGGMAALQLACLISKDHQKRVLLVDACIEDAALTGAMNLQGKAGLVEVLNGSGNLRDLVGSTECETLKFLPAGKIAEHESMGFFKKRWEQMREELRDDFDIVVLHAPGLVDTPETSVLAREADHAVVVARQGESRVSALARALDILRGFAIPILGALIIGRSGGGKKDRSHRK